MITKLLAVMAVIAMAITINVVTLVLGWGLIANAGGGNCNWDLQTEQWRQAARRWRDKYLSTPASKEEKETTK